jgi:pimeloyl-ACP methyl ester carboxylesterase
VARALSALRDARWHAITPDLAGFGDSEPDPPGTWERHVEAIERFRRGLSIERCVVVVHDWGGLIGLRWACEHPDAVRALVISSTGFFPADLSVPALILWGQQDQFAPVAAAHRFERALPDTQLVVIDGAGHFVWDEVPEACAAALTAFLARIRSSSDSST